MGTRSAKPPQLPSLRESIFARTNLRALWAPHSWGRFCNAGCDEMELAEAGAFMEELLVLYTQAGQ
jgi:hypothetical protein